MLAFGEALRELGDEGGVAARFERSLEFVSGISSLEVFGSQTRNLSFALSEKPFSVVK